MATSVNPKSYSEKHRSNAWPISYEAGLRAVSGDFPDLYGFIYVENVGKSTPGKTLNYDFVINPSSNAFDMGVEYCDVYMDFHHINGSWRNKHIGTFTIKRGTWGPDSCWANSPKPIYGWRAKNSAGSTVNPTSYLSESEKTAVRSMGYYDMCNLLISKGLQTVKTDGSAGGSFVSGARSFPVYEPYAKRYLSNDGNWGPGYAHVKAVVSYSLAFRNGTYSDSEIDGGRGNLKRIDESSQVGEDRYRLRFIIGRKEWVWYNEPANDPNGVNKLDNALLGIPDFASSGTGRTENWPPRYDAKFYQSSGGGFRELTAAGKRSSGGSWTVF